MFAILLQALLPAVHHPAGMELAGAAGFEAGQHLCLAPGSTLPDDPGKAPAHHMPPCALCSAMHAIGGFVPPAVPVVAFSPAYGEAVHVLAFIVAPRQWLRPRQQPRAPPTFV